MKGRNPFRTTVQKPWFMIRFPWKYQPTIHGFNHGFKVVKDFAHPELALVVKQTGVLDPPTTAFLHVQNPQYSNQTKSSVGADSLLTTIGGGDFDKRTSWGRALRTFYLDDALNTG